MEEDQAVLDVMKDDNQILSPTKGVGKHKEHFQSFELPLRYAKIQISNLASAASSVPIDMQTTFPRKRVEDEGQLVST